MPATVVLANTDPIFIATPNLKGQTFTPTDTIAKKDLFVAGANGSLLRALSFVTDDTAIVNMDLWAFDGTTAWALGTIQIAAGLGVTVNTAGVNGLDSTKIRALLAPDGSFFMPNGWKLQGSCRATMTAAKTTTSFAQGGDY